MRLIAIAIGIELDVPVDLIRKALAAFTGVERRFHLRGEAGGIMVVDDYGHHPTEIKATLAAAKQGWAERRLVVLFQPHRYTRTRDLLDEFSQAFKDADHLFLTEIYAASEQPIPGVSGAKLAEAIRAAGHPSVTFVERKDQLIDQVLPHLKGGDLVHHVGRWGYLEDRDCIAGGSWLPAHDLMKADGPRAKTGTCWIADTSRKICGPPWRVFAAASHSAPARCVHLISHRWAGGCAGGAG